MKILILKIVRVFGLAMMVGAFAWQANADSDPKPATPTVTVVGAVKDPGKFDYTANMTVMDALTVSGGVLSDTADLSGATLVHDGKERPLDLTAMLKRGDMANNVRLSPGDRIIVPENRNRVYVYGEVRQPGFYKLHANDRLLDALAAAGGPLPSADLAKVNLMHVGPDTRRWVFERDDLTRFLKTGDQAANKILKPGDSVYVPAKSQDYRPTNHGHLLYDRNLLYDGARIRGTGL